MTFFDTTAVNGEEHKRYVSATKQQDNATLRLFLMHRASDPLSPSEVHAHLIAYKMINDAVPLTSIRRSINTLTKQGQLIKTETKKTGPLGRSEMCWKLAPIGDENGQQKLF